LVIRHEEAVTVRLIFARYRELGSVRLLKEDLDRQGHDRSSACIGTGPVSAGSPSRAVPSMCCCRTSLINDFGDRCARHRT